MIVLDVDIGLLLLGELDLGAGEKPLLAERTLVHRLGPASLSRLGAHFLNILLYVFQSSVHGGAVPLLVWLESRTPRQSLAVGYHIELRWLQGTIRQRLLRLLGQQSHAAFHWQWVGSRHKELLPGSQRRRLGKFMHFINRSECLEFGILGPRQVFIDFVLLSNSLLGLYAGLSFAESLRFDLECEEPGGFASCLGLKFGVPVVELICPVPDGENLKLIVRTCRADYAPADQRLLAGHPRILALHRAGSTCVLRAVSAHS